MFAEQPSPIQSPEDAASDRSPMLDGNAHIFKLENDAQGNITNIEDAYANPNTAGDVTEQIQPITEPEVAISYDAESFDAAAQAFPEAPVQPTADERVAALLKIYTEAGPRNEQKVEALVRAMVAEITAASATAENALQQVDALQNTVSRHEILIDNQREEIFGLQLKVTKLTDFIRGNGEKAKTTPSALEDTKPTTRVEVPAELAADDGDARLNLDMDFLNDIPDTTNWVKVKPEVPSTPRKPDNDLPIDLPEVDGDDLPDLDGDLDDLDTDFWNSTPNAEAQPGATIPRPPAMPEGMAPMPEPVKPTTVDLLRSWGKQPETRRPKQKAETSAPSKPKAETKDEAKPKAEAKTAQAPKPTTTEPAAKPKPSDEKDPFAKVGDNVEFSGNDDNVEFSTKDNDFFGSVKVPTDGENPFTKATKVERGMSEADYLAQLNKDGVVKDSDFGSDEAAGEKRPGFFSRMRSALGGKQ